MTEEQADKIIELLGKLVDQTTSLDTVYTMSDICSRLVDVERAIGKLGKG